MRLYSVLLFLFAVVPTALVAQQPTTATATDYTSALAAIEKSLEEKRKELGIPGMSLAIVKDDKVIYLKGLGVKDFERNIPVTPDTRFAIGSSTKAFTAMLAVMSADEGKLSLDDSPKKFLPYFTLRDEEAAAKITMRDLLSHRSGLNRTDLAMVTGVLNREELIKVAGMAKPTAKLGEKFQYQNIMYAAAGEAVAKAQNSTWDDLIAKQIFKPLGMKNSDTRIGRHAEVARLFLRLRLQPHDKSNSSTAATRNPCSGSSRSYQFKRARHGPMGAPDARQWRLQWQATRLRKRLRGVNSQADQHRGFD